MNTQKWVELAVCTDDSRFNMTSCYRDINKLVATDGHRLHIVSNLPDVTPATYLGDKNAVFPSYSQVIQLHKNSCTLHLDGDSYKLIKQFLTSIVKLSKRTQCVNLTLSSTNALITHEFVGSGVLTSSLLLADVVENCVSPLTVTLNAKFLSEALSMYEIEKRHVPFPYTVNYRDATSSINISCGDLQAVVMPMKSYESVSDTAKQLLKELKEKREERV